MIELNSMAVTMPEVVGHPNRAAFSGVLTMVDVPSQRSPSGAKGHSSKAAHSTSRPWLLATSAIRGSGSTPTTRRPLPTNRAPALPVPQPTSKMSTGPGVCRYRKYSRPNVWSVSAGSLLVMEMAHLAVSSEIDAAAFGFAILVSEEAFRIAQPQGARNHDPGRSGPPQQTNCR